ncbi:MAG: DsbA family protein [Minwuia sp.]|nr:DsbA family protein [Minwuia sp.]
MGQAMISFWYDFASPYAYIAAERIMRLPPPQRERFIWRPFMLGAVFAHHSPDSSGRQRMNPAARANKWRDLDRLCVVHGIGWVGQGARQYPPSGLRAARLMLAAGDRQPELALAVYRAAFARDLDISDEAVLAALIGHGFSGLIEQSRQQDIKDALRQNATCAIRLGIFGAPSFMTGGELFFGQDRLDQALNWAG